MSLSLQATAPGEIRIERGNFPARSRRQMVVAESATRSTTVGLRSSRVGLVEVSCIRMIHINHADRDRTEAGVLLFEATDPLRKRVERFAVIARPAEVGEEVLRHGAPTVRWMSLSVGADRSDQPLIIAPLGICP